MNRTWLLVSALLLIILSVAGYYLYQNLERVDEVRPATPTGEAATNRYYAAQQLMQRLGYPSRRVVDSRELVNLPTNSTLVLTETSAIDNRDRKNKAALIDWVRRGGHLLVDVSRRDIYQKDADQDEYGPPLLSSLGITPQRLYIRPCDEACRKKRQAQPRQRRTTQLDANTDTINIEGHALKVDLDYDATAFELKKTPLWQVQLPMYVVRKNSEDDDDEQSEAKKKEPPLESYTVAARFREGNGWVTVMSTDPFRNRNIKDNQNAELFVRLATLPDGKRPVFVAQTSDYPSLPAWLWQNAPAVLLTLLLLTVFVLWRVMPRFGPLLPPLPSDRPGLLAHLRAVGDFHMRHQDYASLLTPLREEVQRALLPMRAHYPEIDSLPRLAVQVTNMTLNEVGDAMTRQPKDRAHFVLQVRVLTILLDTLHGMNLAGGGRKR